MKILAGAMVVTIFAVGCSPTVKTQNELEIKPIEIKPMTININLDVNVKMEKELEDCFSESQSTVINDPEVMAARERMKGRVADIIKYKKSGAIGENSFGYVVARDSSSEVISLVKGINADRKIIYSAVANNVGKKLSEVSRYRAAMISEKAKSGEYFQNEDGEWIQK